MSSPIRLIAAVETDQRTVRFFAAFPAPASGAPPDCRPAGLFTGDPETGQERAKIAELNLCAPTAVTWNEGRLVELGSYLYAAPGKQAASLRWGETIVATEIDLDSPPLAAEAAAVPTLTLFVVKPASDQPLQAVIRLEVLDLAPDQQIRVDAGAGQVFLLAGADGPGQQAEWLVSYSKQGEYTVSVDLLDSEAFWLAMLAHSPLELAAPAEPEWSDGEMEPAEPKAPLAPLDEVAGPASSNPPWLPFRYLRPAWGGVQTYTAPGGSRVARSLALGTYLAVQNETLVGGQVWYQSTRGDWAASSAVALVTPTALRGVELQDGTPPPPPPPGDVRYGVVTAALLNVRARPGVGASNPPIAQLPSGAQVTIYEERQVDGATWYRIGDNRWVHSGWVRIIQEPPPPTLRRGVVTADVLNVRARPGVAPDNPVVDQLARGTEVAIYEEQPAAGVPWYRIGVNRWVHSGWVRVVAEQAERAATAPLSGVTLPLGWVVSTSLNVRARPGVSPDNPPIDEVLHNQRLDILESRTVDGARWHRIGQDRWVLGQWVAAAMPKARPGSIRPSERWVGVNLGQQTLVAYEGDRPVYAAMVATGLPATPTVQGVFRTWQRLNSTTMSGGSGSGYYYLEGVTWTCYFYSGYALHTAYWHDAFGRPRSHGCVNLSPYDAWWLFQWSAPGGANSPAVYVYSG